MAVHLDDVLRTVPGHLKGVDLTTLVIHGNINIVVELRGNEVTLDIILLVIGSGLATDHGAAAVTGTTAQNVPTATEVSIRRANLTGAGTVGLFDTGVQGDGDPVVVVVACVIPTVGIVVNAELQIYAVLNVEGLLSGNSHPRSHVGPVRLNNGEAVTGVLIAGLGGSDKIGILLITGQIRIICGRLIGGPITLGCSRGTDSHNGNQGQNHDSRDQQCNNALGVHKSSPF